MEKFYFIQDSKLPALSKNKPKPVEDQEMKEELEQLVINDDDVKME